MHTSLLATDGTLHTQKAQGLVGYWNFDEADASIAIDLSGHGNHLHSAGCAVCDNTTLATQYYQGWAITPRSDYVCLPIALNSASDAYMGYEVHGGAHCYYSNSTYLTDDFPVPPTAEAISSQDIQQLYLTDPTTLQSAANSRRSTHPTRSLYRRQSALTAAEYEAMWTKLRRDQVGAA
ncbi:hypothetical protein SARC_00956 [Sphaeroforma arctica JP610]|uniref:Uncharacterized protein n=1 Tax=Sphaeroforma arctica JP610 TaxID=667725 RepID=A0A0L0GDF0_9EUKA|nr:hypothetical protein SARC_00956 [Sphaeroforma arctica JP610]KNC86911.1 hypothetical protein SARC_00956 [Sphaeroforma arctica JP610]|eukprot:XP_014160813.1 hypothetical protein SARC_00956 [Sphaeroforma arctica JP610]